MKKKTENFVQRTLFYTRPTTYAQAIVPLINLVFVFVLLLTIVHSKPLHDDRFKSDPVQHYLLHPQSLPVLGPFDGTLVSSLVSRAHSLVPAMTEATPRAGQTARGVAGKQRHFRY